MDFESEIGEILYLKVPKALLKKLEEQNPNIYYSLKHYNSSDDGFREYSDVARIITKEQRYGTLKRQNWKCNHCDVSLKYSNKSSWSGEIAHIDHIFPYSKRWEYPKGVDRINDSDNLQALCPKCNLKKRVVIK